MLFNITCCLFLLILQIYLLTMVIGKYVDLDSSFPWSFPATSTYDSVCGCLIFLAYIICTGACFCIGCCCGQNCIPLYIFIRGDHTGPKNRVKNLRGAALKGMTKESNGQPPRPISTSTGARRRRGLGPSQNEVNQVGSATSDGGATGAFFDQGAETSSADKEPYVGLSSIFEPDENPHQSAWREEKPAVMVPHHSTSAKAGKLKKQQSKKDKKQSKKDQKPSKKDQKPSKKDKKQSKKKPTKKTTTTTAVAKKTMAAVKMTTTSKVSTAMAKKASKKRRSTGKILHQDHHNHPKKESHPIKQQTSKKQEKQQTKKQQEKQKTKKKNPELVVKKPAPSQIVDRNLSKKPQPTTRTTKSESKSKKKKKMRQLSTQSKTSKKTKSKKQQPK